MQLPSTDLLSRSYSTEGESLTVVRCTLDDTDAERRLREFNPDVIAGTFVDLQIEACAACDTSGMPVGTEHDVRNLLGIPYLSAVGLTGKNVRVAIVDGGIDAAVVPVAGGYHHAPGVNYVPGSSPRAHGTMVAYDVTLAAPDARILDYCLLTPRNTRLPVWLSDVIKHFVHLLQLAQSEPGPLVVNNSWSVYDRSEDLPAGDPGSYCANPKHLVNRFIEDLASHGVDVIFAAGNCGRESPDGRCGMGDRGPGNSIHGANSHEMATTVSAVTIKHERVGCSSQGPGTLSYDKPDFAAYAQFSGSGVWASGCDTGTSAACGVASGVVAALRERIPPGLLDPRAMREVLRNTSQPIIGLTSHDIGTGVMNAAKAWRALAALNFGITTTP